jgi:broad specificity polyphosphatase/5'/3'-nucleotidase SurE
MTWAKNAVTLRGRANYGRIDEVAEYVFQFNRTSEGKLLKFGAIAFSKSEDEALAQQVIDTFVAKNCPAIDRLIGTDLQTGRNLTVNLPTLSHLRERLSKFWVALSLGRENLQKIRSPTPNINSAHCYA